MSELFHDSERLELTGVFDPYEAALLGLAYAAMERMHRIAVPAPDAAALVDSYGFDPSPESEHNTRSCSGLEAAAAADDSHVRRALRNVPTSSPSELTGYFYTPPTNAITRIDRRVYPHGERYLVQEVHPGVHGLDLIARGRRKVSAHRYISLFVGQSGSVDAVTPYFDTPPQVERLTGELARSAPITEKELRRVGGDFAISPVLRRVRGVMTLKTAGRKLLRAQTAPRLASEVAEGSGVPIIDPKCQTGLPLWYRAHEAPDALMGRVAKSIEQRLGGH